METTGLSATDAVHVCRDCKAELTDDNWSKSRRSKKDYLCSPCSAQRARDRRASDPEHAEKMRAYFRDYSKRAYQTDKRREYEKEYRKTHKDRIKGRMRAYTLKKEFGLTEEDYNSLLEAQNYRCAICGTDTPTGVGDWHVDHCHTTGKVRGLLCSKCNHMIGLAKDDTSILQSAIKYLQEAA